jgi:hypothetical protein
MSSTDNNTNKSSSLHKRDDSRRYNEKDRKDPPLLHGYSPKEDPLRKKVVRDPLAIEEISFTSSQASIKLEKEEHLPTLEESESSGLDFAEDMGSTPLKQQIQVSDGVYMTLRGSKETQAAYDHGLCIEATCFVCDISLACVPDCDAVVCPQCRMISPVEAVSRSRFHKGGVGLGIML